MFNENLVIPKILQGDMQAFGQLVEEYKQLVFYVTDKLISDKAAVEDISQEVFIKVFKKLASFDYRSRLSTWIASIAYRTALNYLRDHRKGVVTDLGPPAENFYFTEETPEMLLTKKDAAAYLNRLVAQLPLTYRTVLTLFHLNEFSYQEIAAVMDIPEGTVKNYLFRARKLLAAKLKLYLNPDEYGRSFR
nr:sigma-70 family RNA polymerase sigma factor [Chitinophaga nivalis]